MTPGKIDDFGWTKYSSSPVYRIRVQGIVPDSLPVHLQHLSVSIFFFTGKDPISEMTGRFIYLSDLRDLLNYLSNLKLPVISMIRLTGSIPRQSGGDDRHSGLTSSKPKSSDEIIH